MASDQGKGIGRALGGASEEATASSAPERPGFASAEVALESERLASDRQTAAQESGAACVSDASASGSDDEGGLGEGDLGVAAESGLAADVVQPGAHSASSGDLDSGAATEDEAGAEPDPGAEQDAPQELASEGPAVAHVGNPDRASADDELRSEPGEGEAAGADGSDHAPQNSENDDASSEGEGPALARGDDAGGSSPDSEIDGASSVGEDSDPVGGDHAGDMPPSFEIDGASSAGEDSALVGGDDAGDMPPNCEDDGASSPAEDLAQSTGDDGGDSPLRSENDGASSAGEESDPAEGDDAGNMPPDSETDGAPSPSEGLPTDESAPGAAAATEEGSTTDQSVGAPAKSGKKRGAKSAAADSPIDSAGTLTSVAGAPAAPGIEGVPVSPTTAFRIALPSFEGPLDLLLHLIREHKIDIFDIPIALITEKYLATLKAMKEMDLDLAGEFVLMAATLAHIKSRMLLPTLEPVPDEDEPQVDPREELVRRLLEYQKYKAAAEELARQDLLDREVFTRRARVEQIPLGEGEVGLVEVSIFKLVESLAAILKNAAKPQAQHHVVIDRLSLSETMSQMVELLKREPRTSLFSVLQGVVDRQRIVYTFLAILEMAKLRLIRLYQEEDGGDILISARDPEALLPPEGTFKDEYQ